MKNKPLNLLLLSNRINGFSTQNKLNRKEAREGISRLEMDIKYIKCSLTGIVLILVSIIGLVLGK